MGYAYLADRFEKDSKVFGLTGSEREELFSELQDGKVKQQDLYGAEFYAKWWRGRRLRIIVWEYKPETDVVVLVALRIFGVVEPTFKQDFVANPGEVALAGIDLEKLKSDIADYIEHERRKSHATEIDELSEAERIFLETALQFSHDSTDDVVFETDAWVSAIGQTQITQRSEAVYRLVFKAHEAAPLVGIQSIQEDGLTVCFFRANLLAQKILLLIDVALCNGAANSIAPEVESTITAQLSRPAFSEALKSISRRCYPALLLYDKRLWLTIQGSAADEANLALSFEELEVLASMTPVLGGERDGFPVFVNGRPGTGKSTVLHYAFAEYVSHFLLSRPSGSSSTSEPLRPIFLTYSNELLNRAKDMLPESPAPLCSARTLPILRVDIPSA